MDKRVNQSGEIRTDTHSYVLNYNTGIGKGEILIQDRVVRFSGPVHACLNFFTKEKQRFRALRLMDSKQSPLTLVSVPIHKYPLRGYIRNKILANDLKSLSLSEIESSFYLLGSWRRPIV